jgi:hypothetical protein
MVVVAGLGGAAGRPRPRGKDDQRDTPSEDQHAAYEQPDRDPAEVQVSSEIKDEPLH